MKKKYSSIAKTLALSGLIALLFSACKSTEVQPGTYFDQALYMTTANGANGIYTISDVPMPPINGIPGSGPFQFTVDVTGNKLTIPLAVLRSGASIDGSVPVTITANSDTVNKLVTKNILSGITAIPADKYVLTQSVTVPSGQTVAPFSLTIDLPYLRANTDKVFAIGVTIASSQVAVNPKLNTTVLVFNAKLLKPIVAATASVSGKVATFFNTSSYGVAYSWDFGDGSTKATVNVPPPHTYAASGNYTVTLIVTGVTGSQDAVTKTLTVAVP